MPEPTESELRALYEKMASQELRVFLGPTQREGMTDRALAVIRSVLAARGEPDESPVATPCPGCRMPLDVDTGELESKTGCLGFLLVGIGHQPTWFRPYEGGTRMVVMRPRAPRPAARCRNCGLIMFEGPR